MARRIQSRMRKHLGNRTHGTGNKKNNRGKGNKGGKGMAGMGKHKRLWAIKNVGSTLRDRGLSGFTNANRIHFKEMTLQEIQEGIDKGTYKGESIVLERNVKVLGSGILTAKVSITAGKFTSGALEKIKAVGGVATALKPVKALKQISKT